MQITRLQRLFVISWVMLSVLFLIVVKSATATSHLNCGSYAGAAVAQNQRNLEMGCGFSDPRWSGDFNAHFNWCQTSNMAALTSEDRAREAQLQGCMQQKSQQQARLVYCDQYADEARRQYQDNVTFSCGFAGGRWSSNMQEHAGWCMTANNQAVDAERNLRTTMLNQCKVKVGRCTAESDCAGYLCNTQSGQCFAACQTTMAHCAADYICDTDQKCKHKSNF